MKHPRSPTPTPPPEPVIDDRPPIPVDADGCPDLGELCRRWQGYDNVPAQVWRAFDDAMRIWHEQRRDRLCDIIHGG